jgi:hypothetical protein
MDLRNTPRRRNNTTFCTHDKVSRVLSQPWSLPPWEPITPTKIIRFPYLRTVLEVTDPVSSQVPTLNVEKFGSLQFFGFFSSSE